MPADHYAALGVPAHSSQADIRAAYLRVMRASHPDHVRHDPAAAERARRANAAYEVLGDAASRAAYDRLRHRGAGGRHAPAAVASARPPAHPPAYSPARVDYAQAFRHASLRVALAVVGVGTILLALSGA